MPRGTGGGGAVGAFTENKATSRKRRGSTKSRASRPTRQLRISKSICACVHVCFVLYCCVICVHFVCALTIALARRICARKLAWPAVCWKRIFFVLQKVLIAVVAESCALLGSQTVSIDVFVSASMRASPVQCRFASSNRGCSGFAKVSVALRGGPGGAIRSSLPS